MLLDEKILILLLQFSMYSIPRKISIVFFLLEVTDSKINQKDHTPQIMKNTKVELLRQKTLDESRRGETNVADEQRAI